jgi:hypothetical protein
MNKPVNQNTKYPLYKVGHYAFLGVNALLLAVGGFVIWKTASGEFKKPSSEMATNEDFDKSLEYLGKEEKANDQN